MNTIEALLADLRADAPVLQVLLGVFWTAVLLKEEHVHNSKRGLT